MQPNPKIAFWSLVVFTVASLVCWFSFQGARYWLFDYNSKAQEVVYCYERFPNKAMEQEARAEFEKLIDKYEFEDVRKTYDASLKEGQSAMTQEKTSRAFRTAMWHLERRGQSNGAPLSILALISFLVTFAAAIVFLEEVWQYAKYATGGRDGS